MFQAVRGVGAMFLGLQWRLGHMFLFLLNAASLCFIPPFKFKLFVRRIRFFGTRSMVVVIITGAFTGMVLALQVYYSLRKVGSEALLGPLVALSLIRELGPVLSALMITGRAGSALTAEIGIMRISEQIDALFSMALNPLRYLVVPNLVAAVLVFPLLAAIFDIVGIYGGYLVAVKMLGMSEGTYFSQMDHMVEWSDVLMGLYKSLSFGVIVSWICCYKGYHADKSGFGAEGVSKATTDAVVTSSVMILIWDYFLGSVLL
ncbi:MAG: putative ABC transport system permease protein [Nitrospirae bacterium]|nr:MAG: putative ABC transport system permease protein [Nitrospirota bacterium]